MWMVFVHAYTDAVGLEACGKGIAFAAWAKANKPKDAIHHVSLLAHVVKDEGEGQYWVDMEGANGVFTS